MFDELLVCVGKLFVDFQSGFANFFLSFSKLLEREKGVENLLEISSDLKLESPINYIGKLSSFFV